MPRVHEKKRRVKQKTRQNAPSFDSFGGVIKRIKQTQSQRNALDPRPILKPLNGDVSAIEAILLGNLVLLKSHNIDAHEANKIMATPRASNPIP